MSFGGTYLGLVKNERISFTRQFDDPILPGDMTTKITLKAVSCGTDMTVVQEGIPAVTPVEHCFLGWQQSLVLLGQLVESEIKE